MQSTPLFKMEGAGVRGSGFNALLYRTASVNIVMPIRSADL